MRTNEELINQYKLTNDESVLNELIRQNKGLIASIAKRYKYSTYSSEDAFSDGVEGLLTAIKTYDPSKSKFSSYATFYITRFIRKGRPAGEDYVGEKARKLHDSNLPLKTIYKKLNQSTTKISYISMLNLIQQDYSNHPDQPFSTPVIQDNSEWEYQHDLNNLLKNKPVLIQQIIHLMLQRKTQSEICYNLSIDRKKLLRTLKVYFPQLVKGKS